MKAAAQTLLVMVWLPPVPEFSYLQLLSDHHCTTHLLNQQNSISLLLEFAKKLLASTCKAVKAGHRLHVPASTSFPNAGNQ